MARMRLRKVSVLAVALWQSPIYMVIGLIFGLFYGLPSLVSGKLGGLSGLKYMLGMMIGYGVGGFIATAIGCAFFNVANSAFGGITLEFDKADFNELPPPPSY